MPRLRFIKTSYSYADYSTTISPAIEKALEKRLAPSTVVLNTFSADSITSGYLDDPEKAVDLDFCRQQGIVVRRRQNAGGAVFGAKGSAFICLYLDTKEPWAPFNSIKDGFSVTLTEMAEVLRGLFGFNAQYRPLNDIEVDGRKVVPSSARLEQGVLSLRIMVNVAPADGKLMEKAIITHAEKVKDKKIKELGKRFTCLQTEAGRNISISDLENLTQKTINRVFGDGIELRSGELSSNEHVFLKQYQKQYNSDEWFYENSERYRFSNIPDGAFKCEASHKAVAGLLSVTILSLNERIHDVIITGDFHPSPYKVLRDMENALRGKQCTIEVVRREMETIYARPDVEMAGIDINDFTTTFKKAFLGKKEL